MQPRWILLGLAAALVVAVTSGAFAVTSLRGDLSSTGCQRWLKVARPLMEADSAIGALPVPPAERRRVLREETGKRERTLVRAWGKSRGQAQAREWQAALEDVVGDGTYEPYQRNRLTMVDCQDGRRTATDAAELTFTGHEDFRGQQWSGWSEEPLTKYAVELSREGMTGRWVLVDVQTDVLEAP